MLSSIIVIVLMKFMYLIKYDIINKYKCIVVNYSHSFKYKNSLPFQNYF